MRMHEFDRIFQRDDVDCFRAIEIVQYRGKRRGFAGTGRASHEHEAGFLARNLLDNLGKFESFKRRDHSVQFAKDNRVIAFLRKDVDTKARLVHDGVSGVARAGAQEIFDVPLVFANEIERDQFSLIWRETLKRRIERALPDED